MSLRQSKLDEENSALLFQINAALAALVAAGHPDHNDLNGIDDGDINHITDVQVGNLHAVLTNLNQLGTRNHSALQNKNTEANIKHMTDAQIAALHATYTDAEAVAAIETDDTIYTKAEVDALIAAIDAESALAIGIANKRWIKTTVDGANPDQAYFKTGSNGFVNLGAQDYDLMLTPTLPTIIVYNEGNYNLVITDYRIGISDSDANNYVDRIRLFAFTTANPPVSSGALFDVDHDVVNGKGVGTFTGGTADITIGGTYRNPFLYVENVCTNANSLDIPYIEIEYYYAAV